LWLHFPNDPKSTECEDEYLWGNGILVAPVVEKGASSRRVYLPPTTWYDFWTGEHLEGGREINRPVDLETLPLYVRAGSILPLGPVKQYVDEKVEGPLMLSIFPGADASFLLYEDDGISFDYRSGDWMGVAMTWNDTRRMLELRLASGSRMLSPSRRMLDVQLFGEKRSMVFEGKPVSITFQPK